MPLALEFVRFDVKNIDALVASRDDLIAHLRALYGSDLVSAQLGILDDGTAIDVIVWASREAAERAATEMMSDPAAVPFFSQIGDIHEMSHAAIVHSFG